MPVYTCAYVCIHVYLDDFESDLEICMWLVCVWGYDLVTRGQSEVCENVVWQKRAAVSRL